MLSKIKTFFGIQNLNQDDWGTFYPLMNTNHQVSTLSRTDYLKLYTGWVYVATSTISDSIAELEYLTLMWEKEVGNKYKDLIDYDFLKKVSSFMLLNGNCFVYKEMIWNKVDSLQILRPDLIQIEENADWSLRGYRYNWYGRNMFLRPDEVINFEMFSPFETFPWKVKGVSPMQAVAIQAEMDKTANTWNWNFFKNGWSVRDVLSTDQPMKSENKERLISEWKNKYQWVNNAHKIAILDNWLKYNSQSPSQKELDFVESRRFTRDEILSIYKIPKSIIGITDDVNKASATVAENTYYRVCIRPLARQIAEKITKDLFNNEVKFEFINIVPKDMEQLLLDLNSWTITINEYRKEIWMQPIKNWDILKLNEFQIIPSEWTIQEAPKKNQYSDIVSKTLKKHTKWTEEYKQVKKEWKEKIWYQKIQRTDKYEANWDTEIKKVFNIQKADILDNLSKGVKKIRKPKINDTKYKALWISTLRPLFEQVVLNEWNEAYKILWLTTMFEIWNPNVNKYIRDNINRLAEDLNETTKKEIFDVIEEWNEEWLWAEQIRNNITSKFEDFNKNRASMIARTEITRASNEASEIAYKDWWIEYKEYLAELDWRTSNICQSLNGKIVKIWDDFAKKWEAVAWYKLDYENINHPPAHPNCRSTLIPVID